MTQLAIAITIAAIDYDTMMSNWNDKYGWEEFGLADDDDLNQATAFLWEEFGLADDDDLNQATAFLASQGIEVTHYGHYVTWGDEYCGLGGTC